MKLAIRPTLVIIFSLIMTNNILGGDLPCSATSLSNDMDDFMTFDLNSNTNSGIQDPNCGSYAGADIWFETSVPANGTISITTMEGSLTDAAFAIYEGNCNNLNLLLCRENDLCANSEMPIILITELTPGMTLFIRLWKEGGSGNGGFGIHINDEALVLDPFTLTGSANYQNINGEECIQLTSANTNQQGCAWSPDTFDFSQAFTVDSDVYLGNSESGADGIAMVFQINGGTSCGISGAGLGAGGIPNSFIIEMDTYQNGDQNDPFFDHVAVNINGNMNHANSIAGPTTVGNIEDGDLHNISFSWNPATMFFQVFFDGTLLFAQSFDIIGNCFGGATDAYWGFTASTGAAVNNQYFCPLIANFKSGNTFALQDSICENETYPIGNQSFNTTGMHEALLPSFNNCDSIVYLDLLVKENSVAEFYDTLCVNSCINYGGQDICQSGIFTIDVLAENGCDSTINVFVSTIDQQVNINAPQMLSCELPFIILNADQSILINETEISWMGPNGFTSNELSPTITEPGIYTLSFIHPTTNGEDCIVSDFVSVTLDPNSPLADAGADGALGCGVSSLIIGGPNTSMNPNYNYQWTTLDGNIIQGSNEDFATIDAAGTYQLIVSSANGLCADSSTVLITFDAIAPNADAGLNNTLNCQSSTIEIGSLNTSIGSELSYTWSTQDGNFVSDTDGIFATVDQEGLYQLIVSDPTGYCVDTAYITIVLDVAIPSISMVDTLIIHCPESKPILDVQVNGNQTNVFAGWTDQNGHTFENLDTINQAGFYYFSLIDTVNFCENVDSLIVIQATNLVEANAGPDVSICESSDEVITLGGSPTAEGGSAPYIFSWDQGLPNISNPTISSVAQTTNYTLTVTDANGCTDTDQTMVTLIDKPVSSAGLPDTLTCLIQEVNVCIDPITNGTYQWSNENGIISNSTDNCILTNAPDEYQVVFIDNVTGCIDSLSIEVFIDPETPFSDAGQNQILTCAVTQLMLDGTASSVGANFSFEWITIDGNILSGAQSLTPTVDQAGTYQLIMVDDLNECADTSSVLVELDDNIISSVNTISSNSDCEDNFGSIQFIEIVGGASPYLFSIDGGTNFVSDSSFSNLSSGSYYLLVMDDNGCTYEDQIGIMQSSSFELSLPPDITLNPGQSYELISTINIDESAIQSILWAPSDGLSCTYCLNPSITINDETALSLTVVDTNNCVAEATVQFHFVSQVKWYIPNVFSPHNNDGLNDLVFINTNEKVVGVNTWKIFNRWGALVFELNNFSPNDPRFAWDGTIKNQKLQSAVFTYIVALELDNGDIVYDSGDISIID